MTTDTKEKRNPAIEQRPPGLAPALLTPEQLTEKLAVPTSWVREKKRENALVCGTATPYPFAA